MRMPRRQCRIVPGAPSRKQPWQPLQQYRLEMVSAMQMADRRDQGGRQLLFRRYGAKPFPPCQRIVAGQLNTPSFQGAHHPRYAVGGDEPQAFDAPVSTRVDPFEPGPDVHRVQPSASGLRRYFLTNESDDKKDVSLRRGP